LAVRKDFAVMPGSDDAVGLWYDGFSASELDLSLTLLLCRRGDTAGRLIVSLWRVDRFTSTTRKRVNSQRFRGSTRLRVVLVLAAL